MTGPLKNRLTLDQCCSSLAHAEVDVWMTGNLDFTRVTPPTISAGAVGRIANSICQLISPLTLSARLVLMGGRNRDGMIRVGL